MFCTERYFVSPAGSGAARRRQAFYTVVYWYVHGDAFTKATLGFYERGIWLILGFQLEKGKRLENKAMGSGKRSTPYRIAYVCMYMHI
jgi:hypothetical protein